MNSHEEMKDTNLYEHTQGKKHEEENAYKLNTYRCIYIPYNTTKFPANIIRPTFR